MVGVCSYISVAGGAVSSGYFTHNGAIVVIAYVMHTIAVNILRYFDNFVMYPLIATPFVILTAVISGGLAVADHTELAPFMPLIIVCLVILGIMVTALSYLHASHCYNKSFMDKK